MDSVAEFCLVLFIVTTLLSETWGAKDKELYCGGKLWNENVDVEWIILLEINNIIC